MKISLVDRFIRLVQIDSVTNIEKNLASYITSYLKSLGYDVIIDLYGNVYAHIEGKGTPFFLSSHMDTVEPGVGIKPQIREGYIVSNGATILGADNKAAVACMVELAHYLSSYKIQHRPVEFIFTVSEEIGNYGAINFDYSLLKSKIGYCFDSISPIGTIIKASPYYERFDIKIIGKAAHASCPQNANNVLHFLAAFLSDIQLGQLDSDSLLNIGIVQSGEVRNTIPGELILKGEIRSFVESKLLYHKKNIINTLYKHIKKYKMKVKHDFVRENPGYKHINSNSLSLIKDIKQLIVKNDITPKIKNAWGVSDANIFNAKGLMCINLGDGVENAHTKQERIKISDLEAMFQLMKSFTLLKE